MSVLSLTTTYNHSIDFLSARSLGKVAVRRRLRRLDTVAFAAVGLVVAGLTLEDHAIGDLASILGIEGWTLSVENAARLVTLGVLGEFVVHWLHVRATKREQQLSDAESLDQAGEISRLRLAAEEAQRHRVEAELEIARLSKQTAEAYERAQDARLAGMEAQFRAAEANSEALKATAGAAKASMRAIEAEARALGADERAAAALQKLAPRMISPEGARAFHEKLLPFKGQPVDIVVFNPGGSSEIDEFAKNLWGTLNLKPVWDATLYPESEPSERRRPVSGVHIEITHPSDVEAAALALRDCLVADGIEADVTPWLRGDELAPLLVSGPSDGEPLTDPKLIRVCIYRKY